MFNNFRKSITFLIGLFALVLVFLFLFHGYLIDKNNPNSQVVQLQKGFTSKLKKIQSDQALLEDLFVNGEINDDIARLFKDETIAYYVCDSTSLLFWSSNIPSLSDTEIVSLPNDSLICLNNGVYYSINREWGDYALKILIQLIRQFPYENEFLLNEVAVASGIHPDVNFNSQPLGEAIFDLNGNTSFYVEIAQKNTLSGHYQGLLYLLYIVMFVLALRIMQMIYNRLGILMKYPFIKYLFFVADVLILRFIIYYFTLHSWFGIEILFDPIIYSGFTFFNSFGDLILNAIVFLYVFYSLFQIRNEICFSFKGRVYHHFVIFILFGISFFSIHSYGILLNDLVLNSDISFQLNKVSDLNVLSLITFLVISAFSLCLFFVLYFIHTLINKLGTGFVAFIFVLLLNSILYYLIVDIYLYQYYLFFTIITNVLFFLLLKRKYNIDNMGFVMLALILFSMFATYILTHVSHKREKLEREQFAIHIAENRDKIAEYKFEQIKSNLISDTLIKRKLDLLSSDLSIEEDLISYIKRTYFNGFWSKYNVQFTFCDDVTELNVQNEDIIINCNEYFRSIKKYYGKSTICDGLYYLDNNLDEANYLAELRVQTYSGEFSDIYIDINPQITHETLGYPELLIDKSSHVDRILNHDYSYAIYLNEKLLKSVGKFKYTIDLRKEILEQDEYFYGTSEKYNHLFLKVNSNKTIIVSKPKADVLGTISPYSYMLLIFGVFCILFMVITQLSFGRLFSVINFRKQIQTSIISIILISFFVIGVVSVFSIQDLHRNKNVEILNEKAHSVLIELEHKLSDREELTDEMSEYLTNLLIKFSQVFFSDLNLFDLNGNLLASSRPQIFDEGLISTQMNIKAYVELAQNKKTLFIQNERIGNYEFISAYIPFVNQRNELIAYLNLPYFAKQNELTEEVSNFLVAFINIYILLTVISIIIGILVSNYITRPLQLIKSQLSKVEFGKENSKLLWETNDEIGSLVKEYNRMIDELEQSAELLAKSERETAWREMAKQVAHEIKNPLTPMKLSVQYLMRAWDDKAPDWDKRLQRFSLTMIEQIDSLSSIASAFSDFAKMPKSVLEQVDLVDAISTTIGIFGELPNITINFPGYKNGNFMVYADKKQMIRVFNNLIKNAIQAIPDKSTGVIDLKLEYLQQDILITIKDTGIGINEVEKDKIFYPNFTTKSSGMGLGLSMVRSIVKSTGGDIWFESSENQGAVFFIRIPKYDNSLFN
ncbi:MAG: GHKL domain-containing protein [Bacteroidales bacterium]|nr:GHKL domain-containing protein [Bacteroidales bacterium]